MVHICDVCKSVEARLYSFTDQAVLCGACDQSLQTSKSSKKRERVKLECNEETANCDICQDAKAELFCSEDRALICRRCDLMIHSANEFAAKHRRFLLSGTAVGFKALDTGGNSLDEGCSKRPYSLRNSSNATASTGKREREQDLGSLVSERSTWRNATPTAAASDLGQGSSNQGSQPTLIGLNNSQGFGQAPSLGGMTGASLMSPFGNGANGDAGLDQRGGAGPAMQDPGPSTAANNSWGAGAGWASTSSLLRPDSSDLTLASELLGIPAVGHDFTAKDIDAAYIFDDGMDFETGLSSLLEVPNMDFTNFDDPPVVTGGANGNLFDSSTGPGARSQAPGFGNAQIQDNPSDGLVPSFQDSKRQKHS